MVAEHALGAEASERFITAEYRRRIRADYPGLVRELQLKLDDGLATVENFLEPAFLSELQASIEPLIGRSVGGEERRPLIGRDLEGTLFHEVTYSGFLARLANDLLAKFRVHLEPADIYPVLNILRGQQGQGPVNAWHFDATYLTIAMLVIVPVPGTRQGGKFRIWPNVRSFSQNLALNRLYWNLVRLKIVHRNLRNFAVNLTPGNLYFFYGFRCYHGIGELDPEQLRAVCLMNFGGPLFDRARGKRIYYG
jgi:hypothetical protein